MNRYEELTIPASHAAAEITGRSESQTGTLSYLGNASTVRAIGSGAKSRVGSENGAGHARQFRSPETWITNQNRQERQGERDLAAELKQSLEIRLEPVQEPLHPANASELLGDTCGH